MAARGLGGFILPGQAWDLGYIDAESHGGPEHQECNRAGAARLGRQRRSHRMSPSCGIRGGGELARSISVSRESCEGSPGRHGAHGGDLGFGNQKGRGQLALSCQAMGVGGVLA